MPRLTQQIKDQYVEIGGTSFGKTANLDLFNTQDVATSGAVTYVGEETASGGWLLTKVDTTAGVVVRYATRANNATYKTYSTAWTDRASLTYELYSEAFPNS